MGNIPLALAEPLAGAIGYKEVLYPNDNPFKDQIVEACSKGDMKLVKSLEEQGVDFNAKLGSNGSFPIEYVVNWGQVEVLKYFIEKGFEIDKKYYRNPLLFNAVASKRIDTLKVFIDNGVNVNRKGEFGRTVLHHIASINYNGGFDSKLEEVARYLISSGAKLDSKDSSKRTPLDLAKYWDNKNYITFIETYSEV